MQRSGCHYLRVRYEVQTSIVLEHSTQMQGRQTNGSKYIHAALRSVYCMFAIGDAIISLNFAQSPNVTPFELSFNYRKQPGDKYNQIELRGKPPIHAIFLLSTFSHYEIEGGRYSLANHALIQTRNTLNK